MKSKKRFVSLVCLTLGFVLLVGAAFANYDNANGYQLYKESAKKMLKLRNYSADIELLLTYDDAVMGRYNYKIQFNDKSKVTAVIETNEAQYALDGTELSTWPVSRFYSGNVLYSRYGDGKWNASRVASNGLFDYTDTTDKTVRFAELLADVFVGDLKNNFALVKSENGLDYYEVNLAGQQIPEFINAGLALVFTAENGVYDTGSYVTTAYNYTPTAQEDESELWSEAEKKREELGGVIVIEQDRTLSCYNSYADYKRETIKKKTESELDFDDLIYQMGTEPTVGGVSSHFTLDEEGRLCENKLVGTMVGTDVDGEQHTMGVTVNIKLYDYDSTEPQPPIDPDEVPITEDNYYETTEEIGIVVQEAECAEEAEC